MFKRHVDTNYNIVGNFKHIHSLNVDKSWYDNTCQKSSLSDYIKFKRTPVLEDYFLDILDFYGASLKFKARSNTLALGKKISIWDILSKST